ncbi:MAG: ABC transporter substrate-binding protein [Oscillospiraceae bacterium]|nr:ABC transporter substrate-binding protein [Oscillospiraceae bacterium]
MKKTVSFIITALLLAALCIPAVSAAEAAAVDDYVVRVAYGPGLCHAALHAAIENGFFDEEEGFNYVLIPLDISLIPDAAATGTIDASQGMVGKWGVPLENGLGIQITNGIHRGCSKIVVRADSDVNSIADLQGKKIGVPALSDPIVLTFRRALAEVGLDYGADSRDVEFAVFPSADLANALNQGFIDAYAGGDPAITITSEEYGFRTLLDTALDEPFGHEYCCVGFVSNDLARNHPTLAAKYVNALLKGGQYVKDHPLETAAFQLEKEYIVGGTPEENVKYLLDYDYKPSVQGGYDALLNVLIALKDVGVLKAATDPIELTNASFTAYGAEITRVYTPDEYEAHKITAVHFN